jgi:hypothetical protein
MTHLPFNLAKKGLQLLLLSLILQNSLHFFLFQLFISLLDFEFCFFIFFFEYLEPSFLRCQLRMYQLHSFFFSDDNFIFTRLHIPDFFRTFRSFSILVLHLFQIGLFLFFYEFIDSRKICFQVSYKGAEAIHFQILGI